MKNSDRPISRYPTASSISDLKQKVNNIESVSGRSNRTMLLRDEIRRLEALLEYSKVRTNPSYRFLFRDGCLVSKVNPCKR